MGAGSTPLPPLKEVVDMQLSDLAQRRGPGSLHDSKFMTAVQKSRVLKQWDIFLRSGCQKEKFTKQLYHHLMQHCSFIAHYDIHGFYATYFEQGDDTVHFLSQFDDRNGMPNSVEYKMTYWLTGEEYYDINSEMIRIAGKYIPLLIKQAQARQKARDIHLAEMLLAKHGIKVDIEER